MTWTCRSFGPKLTGCQLIWTIPFVISSPRINCYVPSSCSRQRSAHSGNGGMPARRCAPAASTPPASAPPTEADLAPAKVEIGQATAKWRDATVVLFEIPYKFTAGSPRKVYQWRIAFPPSKELGMRPTEAWELKKEGVQKTGIQVSTTSFDKFEIQLLRPSRLIANSISSQILRPETSRNSSLRPATPRSNLYFANCMYGSCFAVFSTAAAPSSS